MSGLTPSQLERYRRDGFVAPVPVFSAAEVARLRARLEAAEAAASAGEGAGGRRKRKVQAGLHVTHGWAWDLLRDRRIVEPVASILGPNLLLWSMDWFIKPPGGSAYISYHQDATYWGLEPHRVASAWIAVSDAAARTGPMRFLPGSHKGPVREQHDTYAADNLLSRGQVVKVEVDEAKTVLAPLAAGEMSIHHVRVIHGSEPNRGADRRIGLALRYCATCVRQTKVAGDHAALAFGEDAYRHFAPVPRPKRDMGAAERALAKRYDRIRHKAIMED